MENKSKTRLFIAWIVLLILLIMLCILNYVKFFGFYSYDDVVEIIEVDESSSKAINNALSSIVNNFNSDEELTKYKDAGITLKATLKNNSIYISHTKDKTTTYEFNYNNLVLNINIKNDEENLKKFNTIYTILIKAVQKRIGNEINIDTLINSHINENAELVGINKKISNDTKIITYNIDITKKIKIEEGE